MAELTGVLVFDTGPLSHFAKQGWLGALRLIAGDRKVVIPDAVVEELEMGVHLRPYLRLVLDATWIERIRLATAAEFDSYHMFARLLIAKDRNNGECEVLAYAKVNGAIAVVDDGDACRVARHHKVSYQRTLKLMCDALHDGLLTMDAVSAIADHLLEGDYRLPFGKVGSSVGRMRTAWCRRLVAVPRVGTRCWYAGWGCGTMRRMTAFAVIIIDKRAR